MFPKLVGTFLFQGYSDTLRGYFDARLRRAESQVNDLSEEEILGGDIFNAGQSLINRLLAERVALNAQDPMMLGEPVEKSLQGYPSKQGIYIQFVVRFSGPRDYFKRKIGTTDGPSLRIPAEVTDDGFILTLLTLELNWNEIVQVLENTRKELSIMLDEVNFLVDHFNDRLRSKVPDMVSQRQQRVRESRSFRQTAPFSKFTPVPQNSNMPILPKRVFVSYSHKDEDLLRELNDHLSQLKREEAIHCWDDRQIPAGGTIDTNVVREIESADVILLLVSRSFLASEYIWKEEVSRAIQRHSAGHATIVPIILRECDWHSAPFGKMKALPKDGRAVTSTHWKNHDAAFADVSKELRSLLQRK